MTVSRWAGKRRVVAIISALFSALVLVYISVAQPLPAPRANLLLISTNGKYPSSPTSTAASPPSSSPGKPVQPPAPSVIFRREVKNKHKVIYAAGYQTPHPEICPSLGAHLKLLILIASALDHADARDAIRLTWGHYSRRTDLAFAFVLGSPPEDIKEKLIEEDKLYGDLIIGNFVDSYSNLTFKSISMLKWAATYCRRVPYMLKSDDDMFINIPRLLNFLQLPSVAKARKFIWGKKVIGSLPVRVKTNKYYVPAAEHPGKVFPDYVSGPAYLMTSDCILPLFKTAPEERYLRLEDVFVTGILAQRAGITRQHEPQFYNRKVTPHTCVIQKYISIHEVRYHEQFDMWKKLQDRQLVCSTPAKKTQPTAYIRYYTLNNKHNIITNNIT